MNIEPLACKAERYTKGILICDGKVCSTFELLIDYFHDTFFLSNSDRNLILII